jgi:hypothetical protein
MMSRTQINHMQVLVFGMVAVCGCILLVTGHDELGKAFLAALLGHIMPPPVSFQDAEAE